jgi:tetrahydromethanopterin S-methyltransferase subunit G
MKRCGATGSQTTRARTGGRIGRGILIAAGVLVALFAAYVFLIAAIFSVTPD